MVLKEAYARIKSECDEKGIVLVAVSKTKPVEDIIELYNMGHRDFGENYVQELTTKYEGLPKDIRWHFIGHLQTNKVKYIAPFVHLIHGVDSGKLLKEINKQGEKNNRIINCLLQMYIAMEETKFGLDENELTEVMSTVHQFNNVKVNGLMGMASFTENMEKVRNEFRHLKSVFIRINTQFSMFNTQFKILSMGMSGDYKTALEEGTTMIRIGSLIFGERNYNAQ